jgi:hypothetical protein
MVTLVTFMVTMARDVLDCAMEQEVSEKWISV